MRYNDLIATACLAMLILGVLLGCDTDNPTKPIKKEGYEGIIANNSAHTLKVICSYDENTFLLTQKIEPGKLIYIVRFLENREYTFEVYCVSDGIFFNSVTFRINQLINDVAVGFSSRTKIWIMADTQKVFIIPHPLRREDDRVRTLFIADNEGRDSGILEIVCDWGVIFYDDKVEYLP